MVHSRWIAVALALGAMSGCGEGGDGGGGRDSADPHHPRTDDERLLAARYAGFVHGLERKDRDGICPQLEPEPARAYGCSAGSPLRIPRELRGLDVPISEVFAVRDPSVPDVIQISSVIRRDGTSLIVFFRRLRGTDEWRVNKVIVGGYG
jgi:hypothetical protein